MCLWDSCWDYLFHVICPVLSEVLHCITCYLCFIIVCHSLCWRHGFKSGHILARTYKLISSCRFCKITSKGIFKRISLEGKRSTCKVLTIIIIVIVCIIDICSIIFFITQFRIFRYILTIYLIGFYPNILVGINIF